MWGSDLLRAEVSLEGPHHKPNVGQVLWKGIVISRVCVQHHPRRVARQRDAPVAIGCISRRPMICDLPVHRHPTLVAVRVAREPVVRVPVGRHLEEGEPLVGDLLQELVGEVVVDAHQVVRATQLGGHPLRHLPVPRLAGVDHVGQVGPRVGVVRAHLSDLQGARFNRHLIFRL